MFIAKELGGDNATQACACMCVCGRRATSTNLKSESSKGLESSINSERFEMFLFFCYTTNTVVSYVVALADAVAVNNHVASLSCSG